jgi:tagatose 1,6-diphosphate aldolase
VVACNAGASGIAVGRAVWKEAVTMGSEERIKFCASVGQSAYFTPHIVVSCARQTISLIFIKAEAPFDWHRNY